MNFGTVDYAVRENGGGRGRCRTLRLTLIGHDDERELEGSGVRSLRLKRILRLTREAEQQGCRLCLGDLSALLLTSLSTLKRDIVSIESQGDTVPLKRKRNGAGRRKTMPGATLETSVMTGEALER